MNARITGNLISELRKSKGYTQSELAKKLNVSDKTISKWENGIAKINIFTDLCVSGELSLKENIGDGTTGMNGYLNARNLKVNAIRETIKEKLTLFGSTNKA